MQDLIDLVVGTYASWSHLVVRLALGTVFFAHGSPGALSIDRLIAPFGR